jgi:hypothetical protein
VVCKEGWKVAEKMDLLTNTVADKSSARSLALIDFGPIVFQRNRPIEHEPFRGRIRIRAEVPEPLELKARAGRGLFQTRFYPTSRQAFQ